MNDTVIQNASAQVNAAVNTVATVTAANNVVSNNKTSVGAAGQVFQILESVANERVQWEDNAYRASNQALYAILQKCYALDWEISNTTVGAKAMREGINKFASKLGFKFKDSTPVINRIVQCVFGNVHKTRISTYSLALREAKKANVSISNIPSFIENAGGVQEMRASKSASFKTVKQKVDIASANVFTEVLGVANSPELIKLADSKYAETECVLLATQQADGTFVINAVVRGKAAINAALTTYYSESSAELKDQAAKAEAANDSEYRQDLISKILGQL